jgi:23S rRNA (cytosine1962-C5)-methyltransferase
VTSPSAAFEAEVKLKPGKDGAARAGHPWIFSGAIQQIDGAAGPGAFVRVEAADGAVLGVGTYNPRGSIAVRLLAREEVPIDGALVRARIGEALALRRTLGLVGAETGYRLVNGEGDSLPGVVVDVYAGWAVLQVLTAGAERLRAPLLEALADQLGPHGVFERSVGGVRRDEGLSDRVEVAWGAEPPERIEIREGAARLAVDVRSGQKTGFYLDQRPNRLLLAELARDRRVLNCFAYTGGFAIAAGLGGAASVSSIETSGPALEMAREGWTRNGLDPDRAEWHGDDVFAFLAQSERRFDVVVLDPPPFARHRADRERAVRGYRDLNRRALKALEPGGLLLTFSCSAHVARDLFEHVVATSLSGSMRLQVIARLGAGGDHPVLAAHSEGEYLCGLLVRRL